MRTDYLGLEAFVAIAELGNFSRAATHLNLSQTALSHRIRKLESDLGVQLFVRSTRDLSLTREAQSLLPQVRRDLARLSEAYDGMRKRGRAPARGSSLFPDCRRRTPLARRTPLGDPVDGSDSFPGGAPGLQNLNWSSLPVLCNRIWFGFQRIFAFAADGKYHPVPFCTVAFGAKSGANLFGR